jgi:hypothetical protein
MRERLPPELTEILEINVSIICPYPYSNIHLTKNHEETSKAGASPPWGVISSFVLSTTVRGGIPSCEYACASLQAHQETGFAK